MCEGNEEEKDIGGMEPSVEKKGVSKKKEKRKKIPKRKKKMKKIPRKKFLLLPPCLWTSTPLRNTYISSRSWNAGPSTLPSIVVMLQYQIHPRIHRIDVLTAMTLRVMIFSEYGHRYHRVRVFRVPHLVSKIRDLRCCCMFLFASFVFVPHPSIGDADFLQPYNLGKYTESYQ
ncbi:hypothetical protein PIB30_095753, partial [Stylosanthes scabra]|nr:hypothetical protein [Stylosanthes scabra]